MTQAGEYEKSKKLENIPGLKKFESSMKVRIIESSDAKIRQTYGQNVIDTVCEKLKIPSVQLNVMSSPQKHRDNIKGNLQNKTLGTYSHRGNIPIGIRIYNLTAKRQQIVSGKTFFHTLLHELCHHIDCVKLNFLHSPHTTGFYKRISYLESLFE